MPSSNSGQIKRITLYKHGIAFFQREASVEGNQKLSLEFTRETLSDAIKSINVADASGQGQIQSIAYQMPDQHKLLGRFINPQHSLSDVVQEFQGARLTITTQTETLQGQLVGMEKLLERKTDAGNLVKRYLLLLENTRGLLHLDLEKITALYFDETADQAAFEKMLRTQRHNNQAQQHNIDIQCQGSGQRKILIAYSIPAPVWKTSYRLALLEEDQLQLTAWAIVDNPSEEDWLAVGLSLVSGLPISFEHNLSASRYQDRPELKIDTGPAYAAPQLPHFAYKDDLDFDNADDELAAQQRLRDADEGASEVKLGAGDQMMQEEELAAQQFITTVSLPAGGNPGPG